MRRAVLGGRGGCGYLGGSGALAKEPELGLGAIEAFG